MEVLLMSVQVRQEFPPPMQGSQSMTMHCFQHVHTSTAVLYLLPRTNMIGIGPQPCACRQIMLNGNLLSKVDTISRPS